MPFYTSAQFAAWQAWHAKDILPGQGGWLDQRLQDISTLLALQLVYTTWKAYREDGSNWKKMSPLQLSVIKAVERWTDG